MKIQKIKKGVSRSKGIMGSSMGSRGSRGRSMGHRGRSRCRSKRRSNG